MLCVLAISPAVFAQNEHIKIKNWERGWMTMGNVVWLHADLGNEAVFLRCDLSNDNCQILVPGNYEVARLIRGEGAYKDCSSVDVYRIGADRLKEKPLGEYCLEYPQS